jgi:hypothetical protein
MKRVIVRDFLVFISKHVYLLYSEKPLSAIEWRYFYQDFDIFE